MTSVSAGYRVATSSSSRSNSDLKEAIDCQRVRHEQQQQQQKQQIEAGLRASAAAAADSDTMFPWIAEFRATCRSSLARPGPTTLVTLLRLFNRNVSCDIQDCYKKSSRAAKLKEHVKEALLLFMYFHRFEQQKDQNRSVYLELMSDLLAMYIDLELVASKRDAEPQPSKISARLVSCLCVYLENSSEHLLDTLLKLHMSNESHCIILDAIISKIIKMIPKHPDGELMYVRYLLVYRLWRRIHGNISAKKQINTSAMSALRSAPKTMPQKLLDEVLPTASGNHQQQQQTSSSSIEAQSTKFYLCQQFDLRKACSQFVRYCRRGADVADVAGRGGNADTSPSVYVNERDPRLKSTSYLTSKITNNSLNDPILSASNDSRTVDIPFFKLEMDSAENSRSKINDSSSSSNSNSNNNNDSSSVNSNKRAVPNGGMKKAKKSEDIVMIDLTDEEVTKIVTLKKRPKIGWLEIAKRNFHSKMKEASALKRNSRPLKIPPVEEGEGRSPIEIDLDASDVASATPQQQHKTTANSSPPVITSTSKLDGSADDESTAVVLDSSRTVARKLLLPLGDAGGADAAKEQQPLADSTSLDRVTNEVVECSSSDVINDAPEVASNGCSVIASTAIAAARRSEEESKPVNSIASKTDADDERERRIVQQPSERCASQEATVSVNLSGSVDLSEASEYQADSSVVLSPTTTDGYYDIQDQVIDGLTLLASVSAQQQFTEPSKRPELKVRPYSALQQQPHDRSAINQLLHVYPELEQSCVDKVGLQLEVSSSELVSSSVNRVYQQHEDSVTPAYDESAAQSNVESNENQNVIYNGETVMLLQKSPNSNLYIINKAAVDSVKLSYNSDEEDSKPLLEMEPDTKPGAVLLKHEPDDVMRRIKPDPDYALDVVHDEMHYAGYCGYPVIHHQSTDCACVSCVYCRPQLPYYIPAPVPTGLTVQEKRSGNIAGKKMYEEQVIYSVEKQQQQHEVVLSHQNKESFSRFNNQAESKLPLKKRLKAQYANHQDPMDYQKPVIVSMADVAGNEPALELGAVVEVTAVTVKATTKRGRKATAGNNKSNNQNVPNCFPRKSSGGASAAKKKRPADDEVENMSGAAKKPRKTAKGSKQQTRSSRRGVPQVNYVYPELDAECNPSAVTTKRKKKRGASQR